MPNVTRPDEAHRQPLSLQEEHQHVRPGDPSSLAREIARCDPIREVERFDALFERYLNAISDA